MPHSKRRVDGGMRTGQYRIAFRQQMPIFRQIMLPNKGMSHTLYRCRTGTSAAAGMATEH
ncbi:hypothetical protein MKJ04_16995 [Pontibacter sp. E15-1]|uniref:hypothetical protein n=1 Tax=Pontibacter sp. E15-1 TaxID=2919918 RepID=UPI001F4F6370|nr:hypothetical protein [Pontibacter sp. E15-1]MCJ8166545.1 hypothetical protein [Pontibacter sp. E15-1]